MTAQEVMKTFMTQMANHGYAYSDSVGTNMLDSAVRASSLFKSIQEAITAMKGDQVAAEKEAVEEVLGNDFADKTMSEISSDILNADAKDYDKENKSNAYYNEWNDGRTTVENFIKERKADIFLKKYCGIILGKKNWINASGSAVDWGVSSGNEDTGAITGSDAGTSTVKTAHFVVPEIFINTYIATTAQAQNITTNARDWVVQATTSDDKIISNGADSINAAAGNDQIIANANGATITSGDGEDFITIAENVTDITLSDLNSYDTLTINGTFEVGSAQIEDTLLVITDKTGKRKIRLGDFETAKSAQINSTTIAEWLTNVGINLSDLKTSNYSDDKVAAYSKNFTPNNASEDTNNLISIDLANVDTSKIGNVIVNDAVVGSLSSTFPNAETFMRNGLTIHLLGVTSSTTGKTNNIQPKTLDELTDSQKKIVAGLFKWWIGETLKLSEESFGISFNSSTAMVKDMGLFFYSGKDGMLAAAPYWSRNEDGATNQIMLRVNMNFFTDIAEDDVDGTSSSSKEFLDRTLAHELTHSNMEVNINYFKYLPQFIVEGSAELVHGIDDERGNRIFLIASDNSKLNTILDVTNTETGNPDYYAGGYMFLRYFAKQAATQTESLPAFGEITATVNLSDDGDYYISGNSTSEVASSSAQNIKLGTVSNGVYTVANTGVHQVINNTNNLKIVGLTVNDTLIGSDAADTVETSEGSFIQTGAGNDSILLGGQYSTIETGADDDSVIAVDGGHHFVNLGTGNDYINFQQEHVYNNTVIGGTGNDSILLMWSDGSSLTSGIGNDSIHFGGKNNIINAGAGNDSVIFRYSNDSENFIDLGAGDDKATIYGGNNTIIGGRGDDSIYESGSTGNYFVFNSAFGKDIIYGFKAKDSIIIPNNFNYNQDGSLLTITDETTNEIKGTINLINFSGTANVISGRIQETVNENNIIENFEENILVLGTTDADSISNGGASVTINGGEGTDTIINSGENVVINYSAGDGNDLIEGFDATSKLIIGAGNGTYSTILSDSDIIVIVDENEVTLKDAASLSSINIDGIEINPLLITLTADNDSVIVNGEGITVKAGAEKDTISIGEDVTSFTLEDFGLGDEILLNETVDNLETISGGVKAGNVTIMGLDLSSTSKEWSIVDNIATHETKISEGALLSEDKKSIIYSEASIESITVSGVISIDGLALNDKILTVSASALSRASIVSISDGYELALDSDVEQPKLLTEPIWIIEGTTAIYKSATSTAGYKLENNQISYVEICGGETLLELSGIASVPIIEGNTVKISRKNFSSNVSVVEGGNYNFEFNDAFYAGKLFSGSKADDSITSVGSFLEVTGDSGDDNIKGGMKNTLYGGTGNDTLTGSTSNDLLHGEEGNDTLIGGAGNDTFAYSSGADLIVDYATNDRISIDGATYKDFEISNSDLVLSYGNANTLTLKDGANKKINFLEGKKLTTNIYTAEGVFDKNRKSVTLSGSAKNFDAKKYSILVTITGATASDVEIVGNKKANIIYAGSGGATLNGDKGNDTLTGGIGSDVFIYEKNSGRDIINNFDSSDMISLGSTATVKDFYMQRNDSVLKIDNGSITVKNTSEFKFIEKGETKIFSNGNILNADKTSVTLSSSAKNKFELDDYESVDASFVKKSVIINGNAQDNSLIGGKGHDYLSGGAGADTLIGGKGNDTLWGGKGSDNFIYTAGTGNDYILDYNYSEGDILKILKKNGSEGSFGNSSFKNNTLTLSVSGGGKIIFRNISATSEFNINNVTYGISGRKLIQK